MKLATLNTIVIKTQIILKISLSLYCFLIFSSRSLICLILSSALFFIKQLSSLFDLSGFLVIIAGTFKRLMSQTILYYSYIYIVNIGNHKEVGIRVKTIIIFSIKGILIKTASPCYYISQNQTKYLSNEKTEIAMRRQALSQKKRAI